MINLPAPHHWIEEAWADFEISFQKSYLLKLLRANYRCSLEKSKDVYMCLLFVCIGNCWEVSTVDSMTKMKRPNQTKMMSMKKWKRQKKKTRKMELIVLLWNFSLFFIHVKTWKASSDYPNTEQIENFHQI